ncbi:hypothetical protein HQQ81_20110 [Microbacteriaceae bacterium VKM Ac-2854]|nr:hypothetical protein [Microbacteriaceae bacterium VKM Ac-2854]
MNDEQETPISAARRAMAARELADLEFLRAVRVAAADPDPSVRRLLDNMFSASPEPLEDALKRASFVPDVVTGFHSGSPREIVLRFAAGLQSREDTVEELGRWAYAPAEPIPPQNELWEPGENTFIDVQDALRDDLIDADMYDAAFDRANPVMPW